MTRTTAVETGWPVAATRPRRSCGRGWTIPLVAAMCAALAACAPVYTPGVSVEQPISRLTGQTLSAAGPGFRSRPDYRINLGDVLAIRFPRLPAYSDTFTVRPDGKISPPLIRSVLAAGRTSDELHDALTAAYRNLVHSVPPPSRRRYPVQVGDVLLVHFQYAPDLNSEVTVRGDGRISLPLVGDVVAERRTTDALRADLKARYTKKIDNPEVAVTVKEARPDIFEYKGVVQPVPDPALLDLSVNITKTVPLLVYVGGEVPAPGIQPYVNDVSAMQAIYTAGGPVPSGDMRSVVILRRGPNDGVVRVITDLGGDRSGPGAGDIALQPFDVVVVPRSTIAKIGDVMEQYIYRVVRPLANSSAGFFFTRQVGAVQQQSDTTTHTLPAP